MHINQLDLNSLSEILSHLCIQEKLRLRSVCSLWKYIIEKSFLTKRTLILIESQIMLHEYCHVLLKLSRDDLNRFSLKPSGQDDDIWINGAFFHSRVVTALFPNVQHLIVMMKSEVVLSHVSSLLSEWTNSLESVSLLGSVCLVCIVYVLTCLPRSARS